jgi:hypothetical protein
MSKRDGARVKGMMMGVGTQREEKSKYGCGRTTQFNPVDCFSR